MKKALSVFFALIFIVLLSACKIDGPIDDNVDKSSDGLKNLTIEQLAEYDGQDGMDSYIAVNGVIYDITGVSAWSSGTHNGGVAGTDISSQINSASHGQDVLENLEIVGNLIE